MSSPDRDPHELVTASEIARIAGMSPSAVSNWRKRFPDFPHPVGEAATGGDLFDRGEVEDWLRRNNRIRKPERFDGNQILSVLDRLRAQGRAGDPAEILASAATLLLLVSPGGDDFRGSPDQIERWLRDSTDRVTAERPELRGLFEPLSLVQPRDLRLLFDTLVTIEPERFADAVDEATDRSQRYAEFQYRTPDNTTDLLIGLADPEGVVFDPAAGSGDFLIRAAATGHTTEMLGQELNVTAWRIATARMVLRGLHPRLALGDSLFEDAWPDLRADFVLCDPPAGVRLHDSDRAIGDPRWRLLGVLDTPPSTAADFAWVAHAIYHLAPTGRAYLLLPPGTLFRGGAEAKFRAELLRQGAVESVITLPSPPGSTGASTIWILRPPTSTPTDVLLVNAHDGEKVLSNQLAGRIRETVEAWRRDPAAFESVAGFAASIPVLQLLSGDASLLPSRWVSEAQLLEPGEVVEAVKHATERLLHAHDSIPAEAPRLVVQPAETAPERFRVADLIEARLVQLVRPARLTRDHYVAEGIPVWEPPDVRTPWNREEHSRFADPELLDPRSVTEPGDIVITTVGELRARVDTEGGHALGTSLHAIRLLTDMFDPVAVAALLGSAQNRGMMAGTAIPRVNVRDLEIPRLDAATAKRLREALADLDTEEAAARSTADAAAEARIALIDAVAAGAATIADAPGDSSAGRKGAAGD